MALQKRNSVIHGLSGTINQQLLFKQYSYGTVVSKMPDRSKVVPSEKQIASNTEFRKAVQYAREILNDPIRRAEYQSKLARGKTVYNTAIAEYFAKKRNQG
jgi:hypothetical protein